MRLPSRIHRSLLFLLLLPPAAMAQDHEKFSDRLFFGGNFGLQFGSYTYVDISPLIGYKITERLSAGLSATYIYYKVEDEQFHYDYSTHIYGGSVFTRFFVTNDFYTHAEFEGLNMEVYDPFYGRSLGRRTVPSLLLGAGYRMPMGSNSSFLLEVLFEVLEDRDSPYKTNPILRIGFGFGF